MKRREDLAEGCVDRNVKHVSRVSSPEECVFLLNHRCSNGVSWRTSTSERRSFQSKFMTQGGKFISQMQAVVEND